MEAGKQPSAGACPQTTDNVRFLTTIASKPPSQITGKRFYIDENGQLRKENYGSIYEGSFTTIEVSSLPTLTATFKTLASNQCLINGYSGSIPLGESRPIATRRTPVADGIERTRDQFPFRNEPSLMFFDLDRSLSPCEDYWLLLTELAPPLKNAGYLADFSSSCGVYKIGEPEPEAPTGGQRYYIIFESGLDVPEFVKKLRTATLLADYGVAFVNQKCGAVTIKIKLDTDTELDLSVFQPERCNYAAAPVLGAGVARKVFEPSYISGGLILSKSIADWKFTATELSRAEECEAALRASVAEEAAAIRKQKANERGKSATAAVEKAVKSTKKATVPARVIGKVVQKTIECHDVETPVCSCSFRPILYGGIFNDFAMADGAVITGIDLLRNPAKCDGEMFYDPIDPSKGVKAVWYADSLQFFSFSSGEYLFRVLKLEIDFSHDNPIETMGIIDAVLNAGCPDIFYRGGELVQVRGDGAVIPLTLENLQFELRKIIKFFEWKQARGGGFNRVHYAPKKDFWTAFVHRPMHSIPELRNVRLLPLLLPSGEIIYQAGYHRETEMFFAEGIKPVSLPAVIDRAAAEQALKHFFAPFSGMPFAAEIDKAAFLAAAILAIQTPLIGLHPGVGISARAAGTGKTKLAECLSLIACASRTAPITFKPNPDEFDKTLLSIIRRGQTFVMIDNVNHLIGGDSLCSMITSGEFSGRILGQSIIGTYRCADVLIVATGNNLQLGADMARRMLMILLDPRCERPESRTFSFDLVEEVQRRLPELLAALFTILVAYRQSGDPVACASIGSFSGFVEQVAKPVKWITGVDVAAAFNTGASEPDGELLAELVDAWRVDLGQMPATVAEAAGKPVIYDVFKNHFNDYRQAFNRRAVGKFLARMEGRVCAGYRFEKQPTLHHGATVWRLEWVGTR